MDDNGYVYRITEAAAGVEGLNIDGSFVDSPIQAAVQMIRDHKDRGRVYLIGNGGSLAACSHMATDLCLAGIKAMALSDVVNATCAANDWGYEQTFLRQLMWLWQDGDVLIGLSCSGRSKNVELALQRFGSAITFTGFDKTNPICKLGALNFWVPSSNYGTVQIVHEMILHCIIDRIAGIT